MLVEFSLTCIFYHLWENFKLMMFTFLEYALNLCIFTHDLVLHSKLQIKFCENLFPQPAESGGENYDLLYQN